MRKLLSSISIFILPLLMSAQTTVEEPFSFNLRPSITIQKKIIDGLNIYVGEEIVTKNNVTEFSKFKTQVGLSYKPIPYFKMAADYTFYAIWHDPNSRHTENFWDLRHRFRFHVNGMYDYNNWQFSVREIFQTTTRTEDINTYQQPKTLMELRSKLKVAYECQSVPITPYVSCELTNTLNAARFNEERTDITYDHVYVDKIRTALGVEYQPAKSHYIDFCLFYDRKYEWEWDATKKGKFKSVTYIIGNELNLSIGYTFKF